METGRVHCKQCLVLFAERAQKKAAAKKPLEVCLWSGCSALAEDGHRLCGAHLLRMRLEARERKARQQEGGRCLRSCGRRVEYPPRRMCLICETGRRERAGKEPLPLYIRTQIREGFKLYRFHEAQGYLRSYLRLVNERQRTVLSLVYGLDDGITRNLAQAGRAMGFTRECARQLHDKALLRIFAVPVEIPVHLLPVKRRLEKYAERLTQRLEARKAVRREIVAGRLQRQPCVKCGAKRAEAHHADYTKPREVSWLCRLCHAAEHAREKIKSK